MRFKNKIKLLKSLPWVILLSCGLRASDEPIPDFGSEGPEGVGRSYQQVGSPGSDQLEGAGRGKTPGVQAWRGVLKHLDLSSAQQAELRILLEASAGSHNDKTLKGARSERLALTKKSREEPSYLLESLTQVLTPGQLEKFKQIQAQIRQRANRGDKT